MRKPRAVHPQSAELNARLILAFAGGLVVFVLIVLAAMRLIFGASPVPLPFGAGTSLAGSGNPVLQTDPVADRAAYDAEKQKALTSLAWADRGAGIAHIPVAEAMRVIAANGVPDWGQDAATAATNCATVSQAVPRAVATAGCPPAVSP